MAKNLAQYRIIAILGKRLSGKTTAAEMLKECLPNAAFLTMQAYAIQAFIELHNMTLDEFARVSTYRENRHLLGTFIEHRRSKNPDVFLKPLLTYINNISQVIVEDVFFYNELDALIKLGAALVWIDTDDKKRSIRYYTEYLLGKPEFRGKPEPDFTKILDNDPLEQEVPKLNRNLMKYWQNTLFVTNNQDIDILRGNIRSLV